MTKKVQISEPVKRVARFLALYQRYELDWTPLDRVAKARAEDDIKVALYTALRRKDRVVEKLKRDLVEKKLSENDAERRAKESISSDRDIAELLESAKRDVSSLGKTIAILAASWDIDGYVEWLAKRGSGT